jgi:hypothetical protein
MATTKEIESAARQYVRKVSGVTASSKATEGTFEEAVQPIVEVTATLLLALPSRQKSPPTLPPLRRSGSKSSLPID